MRRATRALHGDDAARGDGVCRQPPVWLILCVNNVCNLHCQMCDVGLGDPATVFWANLIGEHPQNMTLDLFETVLDQAEAFPLKPKVGLAFTEPLIHPRILEFCRLLGARGFHAAVTTNGTTLPRLAEGLVESGLAELNVSIDGPGPVHDAIRGGHDTFGRITRGLSKLQEVKARLGTPFPRLAISFTVTDRNAGHILEFVRAVEPLGAERINVSHLNFISEEMAAAHNAVAPRELAVVRSNLGTMDPAALDTDALSGELARVREYAASRGRTLPPIDVVPDLTREGLATFYRRPLDFVGGRTCTDPFAMLMVKTDGTVIPAHGRCFNYPVGRVTETPLVDLWNGLRFVEFRRILHENGGTLPACARCCGVIGKPAPSLRSGRA